MLTLAATGANIGRFKSETGNLIGGIVTFYMVATAWTAARRREGTRPSDWFALTVALAVGASCVAYGYRLANGLTAAQDGVPAGMDFFFGFIVLLAAAGEMRMLARRPVGATTHLAPSLAHVLWLFVASGSFFMGRRGLFPSFIRHPEF